MSRAPFVMGKAETAFARDPKLEDTTLGWRFVNRRLLATHGTDSMAQTAGERGRAIRRLRADQDAFAYRSQKRAAAAIQAGRLARELVPVEIPQGNAAPASMTADEHPRSDTTLEGLAKLKPIVKAGGSVTAGNSSGINDGACALLLASQAAVKRFGLEPRARIVASAAVGVPPRIMGIGPVPATHGVLALAGLSISDMDVIELNEAFAAQALAVLRQLGLADDSPFVNPNGGAIALGHPLGATGARLVTTALHELERGGGRFALCTMCIGVGQGVALILERS